MAGKKLKKGKSGNAAQYITRTQAVRKLQLRLSEFRCVMTAWCAGVVDPSSGGEGFGCPATNGGRTPCRRLVSGAADSRASAMCTIPLSFTHRHERRYVAYTDGSLVFSRLTIPLPSRVPPCHRRAGGYVSSRACTRVSPRRSQRALTRHTTT